MKDKTYFGLEVYEDSYVLVSDIKKLPFFEYWKMNINNIDSIVLQEDRGIFVKDWDKFSRYFILHGSTVKNENNFIQPDIITINEFNPREKNKYPFVAIQYIGKYKVVSIDDEILHSIVDTYGIEGENEIIRMIDRGQISQDDAVDILAEKYKEATKRVPCEWVLEPYEEI